MHADGTGSATDSQCLIDTRKTGPWGSVNASAVLVDDDLRRTAMSPPQPRGRRSMSDPTRTSSVEMQRVLFIPFESRYMLLYVHVAVHIYVRRSMRSLYMTTLSGRIAQTIDRIESTVSRPSADRPKAVRYVGLQSRSAFARQSRPTVRLFVSCVRLACGGLSTR
jgi:hypothetical protein